MWPFSKIPQINLMSAILLLLMGRLAKTSCDWLELSFKRSACLLVCLSALNILVYILGFTFSLWKNWAVSMNSDQLSQHDRKVCNLLKLKLNIQHVIARFIDIRSLPTDLGSERNGENPPVKRLCTSCFSVNELFMSSGNINNWKPTNNLLKASNLQTIKLCSENNCFWANKGVWYVCHQHAKLISLAEPPVKINNNNKCKG